MPVLKRPHRVQPLLESLHTTAPEARVLFICDPDDHAERRAVTAVGAEELVCKGSYARKIHVGVGETDEPLIFTGADDLEFRSGWFKAAVDRLSPAQVAGVNDLIPRTRRHATHFLMTRDYAEQPTIDGRPGPFFQGYSHWYCDDELIATARKRGVYAYAPAAHVAHLHPMVGADDDDTYRRGRARARQDHRRFLRRMPLWT